MRGVGGIGRVVLGLEGLQGGAADDRDVVTREVVLAQQLADLELDEVEQLRVVDHVDLVEEDDDVGDLDLAGEEDVLAGLGHRPVGRGDDEDRAVHLGGSGDHVLDVVGVARAVDVGVVAGVGLVLDVGDRDRDPALALLGRVVDRVEGAVLGPATFEVEVLRDRRGQARLAVVDVADRADVHVRLGTLELLLGHRVVAPCSSTRAGCGLALCLLNEFRGQTGRDLGVMTELHRRRRPALGHRPQVRDVAEHLGERNEGPDDLRRTA